MNNRMHCGLLGMIIALLLLVTLTPAFAEWPGTILPTGAPLYLQISSMATAAWPTADGASNQCVIAATGTGGTGLWVYAPWTSIPTPNPGNVNHWRCVYTGNVTPGYLAVTVAPSGNVACVAFVDRILDGGDPPQVSFVPFNLASTTFSAYRLPWYASAYALNFPVAASTPVGVTSCSTNPVNPGYTFSMPDQVIDDGLDAVTCSLLMFDRTSFRVALATRVTTTGQERFCFAVDGEMRFWTSDGLDAYQYSPDSYFEMVASLTPYAPGNLPLTGCILEHTAPGAPKTIGELWFEVPEGQERHQDPTTPIGLDAALETACVVYKGDTPNTPNPGATAYWGYYITRTGPPAGEYNDNFPHTMRLAVTANGAERRVFIPRNGVPDTLVILSSSNISIPFTAASPLALSYLDDTSLCDAAWSTAQSSFVYYWYPMSSNGKKVYYYKVGAPVAYSSILGGGGGIGVFETGTTMSVRNSSCEVYVPVGYHDRQDFRALKYSAQLP